MQIVTEKKNAYQWTKKGDCYFRGYIQQNDGQYYRGERAIEYLQSGSFEQFKTKIEELFGCFSVIISNGDEYYLAVDIMRSMPLYYNTELTIVSDSAEKIRELHNISRKEINNKKAAELLSTSYITGEYTIYDDIKQLDIGCVARIKEGKIDKQYYYRHISKDIIREQDEALELIREKSNKMAKRLKEFVQGRPILVSLSGGYDSRYIVCTLKENGFENVICYSYGKKDSFEIQQAEKVAQAVGYKFLRIEYNDNENEALFSQTGKEYIDYCLNHEYMVYIQNFLAVKKIVEKKAIPSNAVVITGLCNDMHTGYYTPSIEETIIYGQNNNGLAEFIIDRRFIRYVPTAEYRNELRNDLTNMMEFFDLEVNDYISFIRALDCLDTGFSHSKCFLNMNKVHEFFGLEWTLPCWDRELLDRWYSMAPEYRFRQRLYEKYLTEKLCNKYGVGQKKVLNTEGKTKLTQAVRRYMGGILVAICYPLGISIKRASDVNNFASLEVILYRKIKQKWLISKKHAAYTLLLTQYLMEQRYGTEWGKQVSKLIRIK